MVCLLRVLRVVTMFAGATMIQAQSMTSFPAGDGGWQMAAPAVGNIDADAALEIVVAYRNRDGEWFLDAFKAGGFRVAGFPYRGGFNPINVSPTLFDLDGDGRNEILFTAGANMVALRGNGTILWTQAVGAANYVPDAGFHAITNGFYLAKAGPLLPTLPLTSEFFSEVSSPIVVDLEGDGRSEVLTAWKINPDRLGQQQDFNPFINDVFGAGEWGATGEAWSGGVIVSDALTGARKFIYHFHQLVEAGLAVAQLDEDAAWEVLVLNDADSIVAFDITQPPGLFGKGMLHKKFGKNLRLLSGSYQTGVDVHAADIDGDGLDEVLVPGTQVYPNWQPSDSLLDDDGALMWREWKQAVSARHVHGWHNNATLIPVNPDGDNRIDVLGFSQSHEITFRQWNGIELASRSGWPKNFAPLFPTPPVVGDVDGDGIAEIVLGTYDPERNPSSGQLLVFALDGTQKFAVEISGGVKHIPTIADVDQDGRLEVVLRSLAGRVHTVKFGSGGIGKPDWATHRGSAQRAGTRNLYPVGTPIITSKAGAFRRGKFSWRVPGGSQPSNFRIMRAENPAGPFTQLAILPADARSFTAPHLELGRQYIFEVHADYGSFVARSAPFPVLSDLNNNLVANGGFEEDDDSHWDKWFTGNIPWSNMAGSGAAPHGGTRSMEIRLLHHGSGSSITQYSHYGAPEDYLPVTAGVLYSFGGFMRGNGLTENTEHWLEWDSSRTAENSQARPPLPWPSYFTPSLKAGVAATGWTYLNRVFEMPPGFPNVELRHRFATDGPASGSVFLDDLFFRPLPAANDPRWTHWISFGSTWRYLASTAPARWAAASFNDHDWPLGAAKFGQGSGPQNIVTPLPKNQPAYYFRREFFASAGPDELLLAATCTDDYGGQMYPLRLWINGAEIPAGGIESVTGEGNLVKYFDLAPFAHLINSGSNTLAVMLGNTWQSSWDNVAFDVSLRAIFRPAASSPVATFTEISRRSSGEIDLVVSADGASRWRIEYCRDIHGDWRWLANLAFSTGGTRPIVDSNAGPRGRRYYRLVREQSSDH
jgi:hypothetical protein